MVADNVTLKPEDTLTIKFNVSDIIDENGIMTLVGKLSFDTDIFESITVNSIGQIQSSSISKINGENGWGSILYNPNNGQFAMDASTHMLNAHTVAEIVLKVKEDAMATSTRISMKNIVASNGIEDIKTDDIFIDITIEEPSEDPPEEDPPEEDPPEEDPPEEDPPEEDPPAEDPPEEDPPAEDPPKEEEPVNNVISNEPVNEVPNTNISNKTTTTTTPITTNKNKNRTSATTSSSDDSDLPHTGVESGIIAVVGALAVVSVISYMKYTNLIGIKDGNKVKKDKHKNIF